MTTLVKLALTLLISFWATRSYTQEFKEHPNGLIYDNKTITALRSIVDSQNIKYRKYDKWKEYRSQPQAYCNTISLDSGNIKQAVADIKNNISFDSFCKKHKLAAVRQNLLVLKYLSKGYNGKPEVIFPIVKTDKYEDDFFTSRDTTLLKRQVRNKWVFSYWKGDEYTPESLRALHFSTEFISQVIPYDLAKMIQYVDCLIDTNISILDSRAAQKLTDTSTVSKETPRRKLLESYINVETNKPNLKQSGYEAYHKWNSQKDSLIENVLSTREEFRSLVLDAIDEAISLSISDEEIEKLAYKFDTKQRTLQLKRNRKVIGRCSGDTEPREHAQQIATLAAETGNRDIFLRAHLDVLNDGFDRITDGSYEWAGRHTYIRELEKLNVDVVSLLLGTAFSIDNPSDNHYVGSIGRIGRAFSESATLEKVEAAIAAAIKNEQLDDYNRIRIYYLYRSYIYYLMDTARKRKNVAALRKLITTFPPQIRSKLVVNEKEFFARKQ